MSLFALCCFRNASDLLPEFMKHLDGHVDRILCFDDLGDHSPHAREIENRVHLLRAAMAQGADWCLALDVDFRCEKNFLKALPYLMEQEPESIYSLKLRDLWNSEDQYRTDKIWSRKRLMALFPCPREDDMAHYYQPGVLHQPWVPPQMGFRLPVTELDYSIYHLGMVTPEMRAVRVAKFEVIDSNHRFQSDYSYLADESGLTVQRIPEGRGWK